MERSSDRKCMVVYSSVRLVERHCNLDGSLGSPYQNSDICGRSQICWLLGKRNAGDRNSKGPTWKYNQICVGTYEKVMDFSW